MDQKSLDPHRHFNVADFCNVLTAVPIAGYFARSFFRPCSFSKGEEE